MLVCRPSLALGEMTITFQLSGFHCKVGGRLMFPAFQFVRLSPVGFYASRSQAAALRANARTIQTVGCIIAGT